MLSHDGRSPSSLSKSHGEGQQSANKSVSNMPNARQIVLKPLYHAYEEEEEELSAKCVQLQRQAQKVTCSTLVSYSKYG